MKTTKLPKNAFFYPCFCFFCILRLNYLPRVHFNCLSFFKWVVLKGKFIYKYFAWSILPTIEAPTIFIWHWSQIILWIICHHFFYLLKVIIEVQIGNGLLNRLVSCIWNTEIVCWILHVHCHFGPLSLP